jgi:hypothetical protein
LLAAKQIEAKGIVLWKGMQCEVGLLQQPNAGDATCSRKLVPDGLSQRPETHLSDDDIEEPSESRFVTQRCG